MVLLSLAPLLSNISPLTPEWQTGLISLLAIVATVLGILAFFRRKPPIDASLVQLTASIEALRGSVDELKEARDAHSGHRERIAELERRCSSLDEALQREVAAQRSYTQKSTRDLFERIEGVEKAVAQNFNAVERALGRVEGALAAKEAKS